MRLDPETKQVVSYANERIFSPKKIKLVLESAGFQVCAITAHSFVPYSARKLPFAETLIRFDELLRLFPLLVPFAGSYTVVARKGAVRGSPASSSVH